MRGSADARSLGGCRGRLARSLIRIALTAFVPLAQATEFRSVADSAAVMYDAPSRASTPLFVASRLYPVEVVVSVEAWVKVRDHTGTLSWIERKALSTRRMVIVTAPAIDVKSRAEDDAPAVFQAAQNVALELVEIVPGGWARVRHADGSSGFVKARQVWGL